jgi:hypothetical protein
MKQCSRLRLGGIEICRTESVAKGAKPSFFIQFHPTSAPKIKVDTRIANSSGDDFILMSQSTTQTQETQYQHRRKDGKTTAKREFR